LVSLARWLGKSEEELLTVVKLVLIFHDLGKLTGQWQEKIQQGLGSKIPPGSFLAHRGGKKIHGLPPHATVSCRVATRIMRRVAGSEFEATLADPALTAIAHHHNVGSDVTPPFEMKEGWFHLVAACCRTLGGIQVSQEDFKTTAQKGTASCGVELDLLKCKAYTAYTLISRWLRLSDWIATGGREDAILHYEERFGDI
jgi:CRISPR-associated endonuclease Cas3-HD